MLQRVSGVCRAFGRGVIVAIVFAGFGGAVAQAGEMSTMVEDAYRNAHASPWQTKIVQTNERTAMHCMATAIYFEARNEPLEGQFAVGEVILNRIDSSKYPSTVCNVVFQGEEERHRCQFSFACDGRPETIADKRAWRVARSVAVTVLGGDAEELVDRATHYHADYVSPDWSKRLIRIAKIGRHIFYRYGTEVASAD